MALLIEEFQDLESYCTQIEDTLARTSIAAFQSLPPRPISKAMIEEKYRLKIYGPRTKANREYMRRLRAGQAEKQAARPPARPESDWVPVGKVTEELAKHQISEERQKELKELANKAREEDTKDPVIEEQENFDSRVVNIPISKNFRPGE
jgi:hypothetical protein